MKLRLWAVLPFVLAVGLPLADAWRLQVHEAAKPLLPPAVPTAAARADGEAMMAGVLARNLWDPERGALHATASAQETSEARARCTLRAISYAQLREPLAAFACGDGHVKSWTEGAMLPDGTRLAEIQPDHVVVEKEGEGQHNVFLFGKK